MSYQCLFGKWPLTSDLWPPPLLKSQSALFRPKESAGSKALQRCFSFAQNLVKRCTSLLSLPTKYLKYPVALHFCCTKRARTPGASPFLQCEVILVHLRVSAFRFSVCASHFLSCASFLWILNSTPVLLCGGSHTHRSVARQKLCGNLCHFLTGARCVLRIHLSVCETIHILTLLLLLL